MICSPDESHGLILNQGCAEAIPYAVEIVDNQLGVAPHFRHSTNLVRLRGRGANLAIRRRATHKT